MTTERPHRSALLQPYSGVLDEELASHFTDERIGRHLRRARLTNDGRRSAGSSRRRRRANQDDIDLREIFVGKTAEIVRDIDRMRQGEFRAQLEQWDKKYSYLLKRAEKVYRKKKAQLDFYNNRELQRTLIKENLTQLPTLPAPEPMPRYPDLLRIPGRNPLRGVQPAPPASRIRRSSVAPPSSAGSGPRSVEKLDVTDATKQLADLINRIDSIEVLLGSLPGAGENQATILTLETEVARLNLDSLQLQKKLGMLEALASEQRQPMESLENSEQQQLPSAIELLQNGYERHEDALEQLQAALARLEESVQSRKKERSDQPYSFDDESKTNFLQSTPKLRNSTSAPLDEQSKSNSDDDGPRVMASGAANGSSDLTHRPEKRKQTTGNDLDPMPVAIADQQKKQSQISGSDTDPRPAKNGAPDPPSDISYRKTKQRQTSGSDDDPLPTKNDAADPPSDISYRKTKQRQTRGSVDDPLRMENSATDRPRDISNQQIRQRQNSGSDVDPKRLPSPVTLRPYHKDPVRDPPHTPNTIENQEKSIQKLEDLCRKIIERLAAIEDNQKRPEKIAGAQDRTLKEDETKLNDLKQDIKPLLQRESPSSSGSPPTRDRKAPVTDSAAMLRDAGPITPLPQSYTKTVDSPLISKPVQTVELQQSEPNPSIAPVSPPQVLETPPQPSLDANKAFDDRLAALEARVKKLEDEREALRKEFDQKLESKTGDLQKQLDALAAQLKEQKPGETPAQLPPAVPQTITKRRIPFIEFAPPIDLFSKDDIFGSSKI